MFLSGYYYFLQNRPIIVKIMAFFIYADQNGKFVYHGFKIMYKRFKSSTIKLTVGEAKMCFLNIFLFGHKAKKKPTN